MKEGQTNLAFLLLPDELLRGRQGVLCVQIIQTMYECQGRAAARPQAPHSNGNRKPISARTASSVSMISSDSTSGIRALSRSPSRSSRANSSS